MAVIEGGVSAALAGVGAEAANPLHVTQKPVSYGALGHYRMSVLTGTMAAGIAANSEILQFRWTDAAKLAVVYFCAIDFMSSLGTGFTAGVAQFSFTPVLGGSWTVAGTGGTAATITGNNGKARQSMGTTVLQELRYASTAALGAGTKTLPTQPFYNGGALIDTTVNKVFVPGGGWDGVLFQPHADPGSHPVVLAQNEGIVVRATVPATGTWQASMSIAWAEVTAY